MLVLYSAIIKVKEKEMSRRKKMRVIERYNRINEKANKIADLMYDVVDFLAIVFAVVFLIKMFNMI